MATVMIVVGTRPNFMKAAPLVTAFDALEGLSALIEGRRPSYSNL